MGRSSSSSLSEELLLEEATKASKSGLLLVTLLVVSTLLGGLLFLGWYRTIRASNALIPSEVLGGVVATPPFREAAAFAAEGGVTVVLSAPERNAKVSLAISDRPSGELPEQVFPLIRQFRISKQLEDSLSPLSQRFLSAQFDARRAKNYTPMVLTVREKTVQAASVEAKNDEHFVFGILRRKQKELAFAMLTMKKPLKAPEASALLEALPIVTQDQASAGQETP